MSGLRCPKCDSSLRLILEINDFGVLKCKCSEFSRYKNIIYLKDDAIQNKSTKLIHDNNEFSAIKTLLNLPLRVFLPLFFLTKSNIAKMIGLDNTLRILTIFGFNKEWSNYLINRTKIPYFQISKSSLKFIKNKNVNILDLGCGTGHFIENLKQNSSSSSIIGIDISFLNLFLANYFSSNILITFVCYDIENKLPLKSELFDFIHMADTFQYIKAKEKLIFELGRVVNKNGVMVIPHTHQKSTKTIIGITQYKSKIILEKSGFKKIIISSDNNLLLNINPLNILKLSDSDAYSVVASKVNLPLFEDWNNKKIIFIQPHLDDAVLSADLLIRKLTEASIDLQIITVFTKGNLKEYTPQAEAFISKAGFDDPEQLFQTFKNEDISVMKNIGVRFKHLNFTDAAFRKDKKGTPIYKSASEQFSGNISVRDKLLTKQVMTQIKRSVKSGNLLFICPLGVGGHADHIIVRKAVEMLKKPVIYWQDYPYNNPENLNIFFKKHKNYKLKFELKNDNYKQKIEDINLYKSQIKMLFPNNQFTDLAEKYYIK